MNGRGKWEIEVEKQSESQRVREKCERGGWEVGLGFPSVEVEDRRRLSHDMLTSSRALRF